MADKSYLIPDLRAGAVHQAEITVKKSRFITSIAHTSSRDQCQAFIARITERYHDARHNCFAYNACEPLSTAICGCSDDGEPHGTAGQPMLKVLLHCGIGEITVVVTRYFGGILLGTGGLVKAYQDSVKEGLKDLPATLKKDYARLSVILDHRYVSTLMRLSAAHGAAIEKQEFKAQAEFELVLESSQADAFCAKLGNECRGAVSIVKL